MIPAPLVILLALVFLYAWIVSRGAGCLWCGGREKECNCGRKTPRL